MRSSLRPYSVAQPRITGMRPAGIAERSSVGTNSPLMHLAIKWLFYAFVFSIPFENMDIGSEGGLLSLAKLIGYAFFAVALLAPKVCFKAPPLAFWCFAIYWFITILLGLFNLSYGDLIFWRLFQQGQLLLLFWVAYNLMLDENIAKQVLWVLVVSCFFLSILQMSGVAATQLQYGDVERVSALGTNPNQLGMIFSLSIIALLGVSYGRIKLMSISQVFVWVAFGVLSYQLVATGSRGAQTSLVLGILVFLMRSGAFSAKVRDFGALFLVVVLGMVLITQSDVTSERWTKTLESGDIAQRQNIYPAAWGMFLDKPIAGWGPIDNYYELGARLNVPTRDTHNLFLWILTESGLIGAIPFFAAMWLCLRAAWQARRTEWQTLPLALLVTLLFCNMTGTNSNHKLHWIILALIVASSRFAVRATPDNDTRRRGRRTLPV